MGQGESHQMLQYGHIIALLFKSVFYNGYVKYTLNCTVHACRIIYIK